MEHALVRQAIRTAVAIAAASSHGGTPEVIADLRDEAAQLIGLCVHPAGTADELRGWCEDATALMQRLINAGGLPEEPVLHASAAVLRLRLVAARTSATDSERSAQKSKPEKEKSAAPRPEPEPVELTENQQRVVSFVSAHPGVRTKDIVEAMAGTLSSRSIKRYLSELVGLRVMRREKLDDGGVAYAVTA